MKWLWALFLALLTAKVAAATAYVTDELVLGVYAEQNGQGQRLATLHSGTSVETLGVAGEFTEVRLNDGTTTGWVKTAYLTAHVPATVRIKQLEEELDRSRATTPALAEAAAHSEVLQLKRELAAKQAQLDDAPRAPAASAPGADAAARASGATGPGPATRDGAPAGMSVAALAHIWIWLLAILAALACGFWAGYATLARRIHQKFGGIKVY